MEHCSEIKQWSMEHRFQPQQWAEDYYFAIDSGPGPLFRWKMALPVPINHCLKHWFIGAFNRCFFQDQKIWVVRDYSISSDPDSNFSRSDASMALSQYDAISTYHNTQLRQLFSSSRWQTFRQRCSVHCNLQWVLHIELRHERLEAFHYVRRKGCNLSSTESKL